MKREAEEQYEVKTVQVCYFLSNLWYCQVEISFPYI